jgi:hypothetical protein
MVKIGKTKPDVFSSYSSSLSLCSEAEYYIYLIWDVMPFSLVDTYILTVSLLLLNNLKSMGTSNLSRISTVP